jgi:hypothetical protein
MMDTKEVARSEFPAGMIRISVCDNRNAHDNTSEIAERTDAKMSSGQLLSFQPGEEVVGMVEVHLTEALFVRGIWAKFSGLNVARYVDKNGSYITNDLLQGDEDHYSGGLHEVFLGFGEECIDENAESLVEIQPQKCKWPFYFRIPDDAPLSYKDNFVHVTYTLSAVLDAPDIHTQLTSATYHVIVDSLGSDTALLGSVEHFRRLLGPSPHAPLPKTRFPLNPLRFRRMAHKHGACIRLHTDNMAIHAFNTDKRTVPGTIPRTLDVICKLDRFPFRDNIILVISLQVETAIHKVASGCMSGEEQGSIRYYRETLWQEERLVGRHDEQVAVSVPVCVDANVSQECLRNWPEPKALPYSLKILRPAEMNIYRPHRNHDKRGRHVRQSSESTSRNDHNSASMSRTIVHHTASGPLFDHSILLIAQAFHRSANADTPARVMSAVCEPTVAEIFLKPTIAPR